MKSDKAEITCLTFPRILQTPGNLLIKNDKLISFHKKTTLLDVNIYKEASYPEQISTILSVCDNNWDDQHVRDHRNKISVEDKTWGTLYHFNLSYHLKPEKQF